MFTTYTLQSPIKSGTFRQITYSVHKKDDLVLIDDGFCFNLSYSKDGARNHASQVMKKNPSWKWV